MIQHSNLTKHLKDDKNQKCNKNNNEEIKTAVVKTERFRKQKNKIQLRK
jgi:hypothetical protein